MDSNPQLRLLHVSDLHFGKNHICGPADPTGASAGIPNLQDLVRKDLDSEDWKGFPWAIQRPGIKPMPLLIAATGDLTQQAKPKEFDLAHDFLKGLAHGSLLGSDISIRNLFVVPGNHDVVFDQREPEHRFAAYCTFYNKLFKEIQPDPRSFARPEDATSLSQVHAFPNDRFLIAEINSCFYVEKETVDESRGQIDPATIASLRRELEGFGPESKEWIKIAIMHHHPVLLPSFIEPGRGVDSILNAKALLRLLRENGFQLLLHGHKHFPQAFTYDPVSAWSSDEAPIPQLIVAGGSCGSSSLPNGTGQCNTYNLITVKWNPSAQMARIQVVSRGLSRMGQDDQLDPDRWTWKTIRVFDKTLSPYPNLPMPSTFERVAFPAGGDVLEEARDSEYSKLRHNMPVVEVLPSLLSGQGYEARVWLVRHRHHSESPKRVTWSAGRMFERKICEADAAPDFCVSIHYWGPMLIQVQLEFEDGETAVSYLYARLPDATTRR